MPAQTSQTLAEARQYCQKHTIAKGKPLFHMACPVGWLNDPNGLSVFNGEVHLFYQYYPYQTQWGPTYWGHCKTKDFLHWQQLPVALAPDMPYDQKGCFSGSAIELNGRHVILYTGVSQEEVQQQCIAIGDGTDYQKTADNPVISASLLPNTCNAADFRDPKVWFEDGRYYAMVGSRSHDNIGQVALLSSNDFSSWIFESILAKGREGLGEVWECPDFFTLNDQRVLVCSPQFMEAAGDEFHNGNGTLALIGDYDTTQKQLLVKREQTVDYGLDFYAPQTVLLPDGRRVMIGWLQSWDNDMTPRGQGWSGIMSIPRELSLRDGRLIQWPVAEVETLRGKAALHRQTLRDETVTFADVTGRAFDLELALEMNQCESFELRFAMDERHYTSILIRPQENTVMFDRTYCGVRRDNVCARTLQVPMSGKTLELRLLMDQNTVELFVSQGAYAMSALVPAPLSAQGISFCAKGEVNCDLAFYAMGEAKDPEAIGNKSLRPANG